MSEWWDRYLFDDLIGLEAAAVTSDGSRHIGPFVRFGDYLTVDDTCVFTRKDKGDGVRLVNDRNDEHCGLSLSGSASERL